MGEITSKIKAKKRNTLAGGEYGGVNKQLVRLYFMAAVQKECPECLEALYNDVYMGAFETHKYPDDVFDWHDLRLYGHDVETKSDRKALKTALTDWGIKYHIAKPWVFDIAIDTLHFWYKVRDKPKYLSWHFKDLRYYNSGAAKAYSEQESKINKLIFNGDEANKIITLQVRGWNRFKESKTAYRKYAVNALKRELTNYTNQCDREFKKKGILKTMTIRQHEHFNWLALYQVKPLNVKEIANKLYYNEDTIRHALNKTSELIGIKLRK